MAFADTNLDDEAILRSVAATPSPALQRIASHREEETQVQWNLPGFGGKVRVGTAFGDLPIEALRLRDELRTLSGRIARVEWIDKIHLDENFIAKHPSARPVRIAANAFGAGKPMWDLVVSPAQSVCPEAHAATRFLAASDLNPAFGASRVQSAGLTYYRFHCGEPVVVRVEGVWVKVQP
jgi:hypothetical protein